MKSEIKKNVYFAYSREIEYVATVAGMLADNLDGRLCREIYGEEFIIRMQKKHRELVEIVNSLFFGGLEILEFLMSYETEEFHLDEYRQYVEQIPQAQFIHQFSGYRVSIEEIEAALQDEELLTDLMDEGKLQISSYVNLKRIVYHREEFFDLLFACIKDIKTPELEEHLDRYQKMIPRLQEEIEQMLAEQKPLEVVETIVNKGRLDDNGYHKYAFLPVCMLPRNAVTYYEKNIYVMYSKNRMVSRQKALNMLKVMADETRIRIIDLLSESDKANGKKIARWAHIAPSTVSHHMEQLIDCGIVKEEKNGASKEYTINYENGENFIRELEGIILKNKDHILYPDRKIGR